MKRKKRVLKKISLIKSRVKKIVPRCHLEHSDLQLVHRRIDAIIDRMCRFENTIVVLEECVDRDKLQQIYAQRKRFFTEETQPITTSDRVSKFFETMNYKKYINDRNYRISMGKKLKEVLQE